MKDEKSDKDIWARGMSVINLIVLIGMSIFTICNTCRQDKLEKELNTPVIKYHFDNIEIFRDIGDDNLYLKIHSKFQNYSKADGLIYDLKFFLKLTYIDTALYSVDFTGKKYKQFYKSYKYGISYNKPMSDDDSLRVIPSDNSESSLIDSAIQVKEYKATDFQDSKYI